MPNKQRNISEKKEQIKQTISQNRIKRKEKITKTVTDIKLKSKVTPNRVSTNKLKLLITIVNRNKGEYFMDLIQSFEVNMQMAMLGNGMAPQSMLELLGLASNEKLVIASVIQESKIRDALTAIDEKFNSIKDGKGIAFTIPLTSVIGTLIYGFLSNNKMAVKEEKTK